MPARSRNRPCVLLCTRNRLEKAYVRAQVTRIVPESNHALRAIVLLPQNTQASRAQQKELPGLRFETEPAGSQVSPRSRSPSRRALCSPRSVSGESISPKCRPVRFQADSPCRVRQITGSVSVMTSLQVYRSQRSVEAPRNGVEPMSHCVTELVHFRIRCCLLDRSPVTTRCARRRTAPTRSRRSR